MSVWVSVVTVTPSTAVVLPQSDDESVSSASSSDQGPALTDTATGQQWETFDDLDTQRPPLPPPRTELLPSIGQDDPPAAEKLLTGSTGSSNNPFRDFDYEAKEDGQSELNFNVIESNLDRGGARSNDIAPSPFESLHLSERPQSPFDDFSSSVAQALKDNSENTQDVSSVLSNTSQDLSKIVEEEDNDLILANSAALEETSPTVTMLPTPLVPTTTAAPTQDIATDLLRAPGQRKMSAPSTMSSAIANSHTAFHPSASAPVFPLQQPSSASYTHYSNPFYNYGYQQMTYSSKNLPRPSGPRSPKFAQEVPLSIPQVPLNYNKKRPPPPPRPQPYSRARDDSANKDDPLLQRLASIGEFNPFESLLGSGGMEAYVKTSTGNDSPLV